MANYKVTMIFEEGKSGWTESWYWPGVSPNFGGNTQIMVGPPQPALVPDLANWYAACAARVAMLPKVGILRALRFSDVDQQRTAYIDESVVTIAPPQLIQRDQRRRALATTVQAGDGNPFRRQFLMRGIPDVYAVFNERGQSDTNSILQLLNIFFVKMRAAGASLKALAKDYPTGHNPPMRVVNVERLGLDHQWIITTDVNNGLLRGNQVRLSRVKTLDSIKAPPLNGIFTASPFTDATHDANKSFAINLKDDGDYAGFLYVGGGVVQRRFYDYSLISHMSPDRWASHKVGRPIAEDHGRSRRQPGRPSIPVVSLSTTSVLLGTL